MVDSISMPNAPSISENIATPNTLDLEIEVAQELLETQWTLNQKSWILHHKFFLSQHFFVVNDDDKPNRITTQSMHYVIFRRCVIPPILLKSEKV